MFRRSPGIYSTFHDAVSVNGRIGDFLQLWSGPISAERVLVSESLNIPGIKGPVRSDLKLCLYSMLRHLQNSVRKPSQAKPNQTKFLTGAETCSKRKSTSPCLLDIPAFDRIAGLYDRHVNYNRGICLR